MAEGLALFASGLSAAHAQESDMPLCGYNKEMARGLETFASGLAVQTKKRASEEFVSIDKIPEIEIAELGWFLDSLDDSDKQDELAGIIGLTIFVRYLYVEMNKVVIQNPTTTPGVAFKQVVDRVNRLMFKMEEHYYTKLRPELGIPGAVRALRPYLEAHV